MSWCLCNTSELLTLWTTISNSFYFAFKLSAVSLCYSTHETRTVKLWFQQEALNKYIAFLSNNKYGSAWRCTGHSVFLEWTMPSSSCFRSYMHYLEFLTSVCCTSESSSVLWTVFWLSKHPYRMISDDGSFPEYLGTTSRVWFVRGLVCYLHGYPFTTVLIQRKSVLLLC